MPSALPYARHQRADAAEADEPERLAGEHVAGLGAVLETAGAHRGVGGRNPPRGGSMRPSASSAVECADGPPPV